jgi:hypothetical protein
MNTSPSPQAAAACAVRGGWPIQRILFLLAGSGTPIGVLLAATVSRAFLVIPVLVGANQLLMAATGWCPMSLLLTRLDVGAHPVAERPAGERRCPALWPAPERAHHDQVHAHQPDPTRPRRGPAGSDQPWSTHHAKGT